jgi:hypothetical protein
MKHLLNDLTEQEKNSIREQHTGGMVVPSEKFSKLVNTKLGDAKPLVNEQKDSEINAPQLIGKTVTFYKDKLQNEELGSGRIRKVFKNYKNNSGKTYIKLEMSNEELPKKLQYRCDQGGFVATDLASAIDPTAPHYHNIKLAKTLDAYCKMYNSPQGPDKPKTDF